MLQTLSIVLIEGDGVILFREHKHPSLNFACQFCMVRLSGGCFENCPKVTLNICPRVVFIKFPNTKRFLLSSERDFEQKREQSVQITF